MRFEQLAIVALALGLGGFTKGLMGMGLPLVAVPVLAGFVGVEQAVLTMIIPSVVLNAYPAWTHRSGAGQVPELRRILIGAAPGALVGAAVLRYASPRFLEVSLAVWIFAYLMLRLAHPHFRLSDAFRKRWSPLVGAMAGALQAATGISAPIIAPYVNALRLEPQAYVYAVCVCFGTFAAAHLAVVITVGILDREIALQGLLAIAPALVFIPIGVWARRFVSARAFDLFIRATLALMGLRLLYAAWQS
ncbi:MAG: sulfite exporter TauE/SafE family protein [Gammaproteobacteria bacterium]